MIKDFKNQEIQFEKHFQFDKLIKGDQIKATFLPNGELELIIPNEGVAVNKDDNTISIAINEQKAIEESEETPAAGVAEVVREDVEMEA